MKEIILENNSLKAIFAQDSGALLYLVDKETGWEIERRKELGATFNMLVPLPERRHNCVLGDKQDPPHVDVDHEAQKITFTWQSLRSEHEPDLNITFRGIVALSDSGLVFTGEVLNDSCHTIESVAWPVLGDLSRPKKTITLKCQSMDLGCGMVQVSLFPSFATAGYWGVDYPQNTISSHLTPYVLISNEEQGLYVGYHDTTQEHIAQFHFCWKPGYEHVENIMEEGLLPEDDVTDGRPVHMTFSVCHLPFFNKGESGDLKDVVVNPYRGAWHDGVDNYKKWRQTWFTYPTNTPEWVSQVHSWQQIHINSPEDELRCRYKDIITYAEDCKRHGVKAIQLVGWTKGGQDRGNPSHDTDHRLGTWEELRDAISTIEEMGIKVVLFNKYTWADQSTDWFRDELIKYCSKDPYLNCHFESGYNYQTITQLADINLRRLMPMCHNSAAWRDVAKTEFKKSIELGASGMLYDEGHQHGNAYYCFDPDHGHHVPANVNAGDCVLAQDFLEITDTLKPDYLYAIEGAYDLEFRHYHLSYFRISPASLPVSRYISPDSEMMVAVGGLNDRNAINAALMCRYILSYEPRNFKGRLDEFPRTLEYGKKVDALRRKFPEHLWFAEFRHVKGAAVKVDGKWLSDHVEPMRNQKFAVLESRQTGKKAVVVMNTEADRTVDIEVALDEPGPLTLATPECPEAVASNGRTELPPLSASVFLEPQA